MRTGQTIRPALSLNTGGGGLTPEQEAAIAANTAQLQDAVNASQSELDAAIAAGATDAEIEAIRATLQANIDALAAATGAATSPAPIIVTNNPTGFFRLGRFTPPAAVNVPATVITGFDLAQSTDLTLKFFFRDQGSDRGWPPTEVDVDNFLLEETDGQATDAFVHIHDNDWVGINLIDAATGEMSFTESGRDVEIAWIELWGHKTKVSPLVGFMIPGPPGLEATITGLREIRARTIVNGAMDYPIFAARRPDLIAANGNDLVISPQYEGAHFRNLGGNAPAFGDFATDKTAANGLSVQSRFTRNENTRTGGGAFRLTGAGSEIPVNGTVSSIDNETAPAGFAQQWYFIFDDFAN